MTASPVVNTNPNPAIGEHAAALQHRKEVRDVERKLRRRYLLALAELFGAPLSASTHVVHAAPQRLSDKPAAGAEPSEYAARRSTLRRVLPSGERVSPHLRHPRTTNPCIRFDTVCDPHADAARQRHRRGQ